MNGIVFDSKCIEAMNLLNQEAGERVLNHLFKAAEIIDDLCIKLHDQHRPGCHGCRYCLT